MNLTTMRLMSVAAFAATGFAQVVVSGNVQDDSGATLPGVTVEIHQWPAAAASNPVSGSVVQASNLVGFSSLSFTTPSGQFSFSGVPTGVYFVCAYSAVPGYISNCEWRTQFGTVSVGQTNVTLPPVVISKGSVVTLTLQDATGILNSGSHHFYPGVMTSTGYYAPARLVSSAAYSRTYVATIPKTVAAAIFVDSDRVVSDSGGSPITLRAPSDIKVSGAADSAVALAIN